MWNLTFQNIVKTITVIDIILKLDQTCQRLQKLVVPLIAIKGSFTYSENDFESDVAKMGS